MADPLTPRDLLRIAQTDATSYAEGSEGARALLELLARAQDDLNRRIAYRFSTVAEQAKDESTFTSDQLQVTMEQLLHVTKHLVKKLKKHVSLQALKAARKAAPATIAYLNAAEQRFTGINQVLALNEAKMFEAAVVGQDATVAHRLMAEHPDGKGGGILQRYGFEVVKKFERELRVGVITRKPFAEVREALVDESPFLQSHPRYWAERITRTEMMGGYNRGAHAAMKEANEELEGDMVRILVATFDERTGADSYNVHGEIRRMTEPFEYVNWEGEHEQFMAPPNRPQDREVVVAHRTTWPIPAAFKPKSTSEVAKVYARQKLKFHGRPDVMSTVKMPSTPRRG